MPLLDQQELMEAPPERRLIVPSGHTAIWGVDPSTLRIAVAGVYTTPGGAHHRWVRTTSFAPLEGAKRLSAIYVDCKRFIVDLANKHPHPGLVMIEQPSGSKQSVNLPLIYAVGIIQAAIFDGLLDATGQEVVMESCTSSWWKKRAVGRGNIYKPKSRKDEYAVVRWANENGYVGCSWDESDAWGICEAARREVALEERPRAA